MNLALAVIGSISATIAFLPWLAESAADPINAANFARIKPGMTRAEVEKFLGSKGEEGQGDGRMFPVSWQGRGRNVIIVGFRTEKGGEHRSSDLRTFFNPSLRDRFNEWWGGYELHPDGSRSKRLKDAS
jgi:hypothetical protein